MAKDAALVFCLTAYLIATHGGHPLLFHCTGATWVMLFGTSLYSFHLFALTITLCFAFAFYYVVGKTFNAELAIFTVAICLAQPNIFAQSTLVLPELYVLLWSILTIYSYVKNNYFYYFLFGSFLLLTKETGLIIIASILIYHSIDFASEKLTIQSLKNYGKIVLILLTPLVLFISFLITQHFQKGYFFFPEHLSLINLNWKDLQEKLKSCYDLLFDH